MRRAAALLAVVAVLVTGCAAIPTSGSVHQGDVITDDSDVAPDLLPSGPRAGATQEEIVEDFLQAETSPLGDYEIAREYLAPSVRATWDPDAQVLIRGGELPTPVTSGNSVTFAIAVSARVDKTGLYTDDEGSSQLTFQLVQEKGEWRISKLDPGIVLSQDNFPVVFTEQPIYFFDPSYAYLVPDVRWFPQVPLITTRIATALVEGPSPLLHGAVVSAFPTGTTVGDEAVAVDSGTATVDLSDELSSATDEQKARIQQQLKQSFSGLATVTTVALTVGGIPVKVSDSAAASAVAQPDVGALPLVLSEGVFGFASTGAITPASGVAAAVQSLQHLVSAVFAEGSGTVAARTTDGVIRIDKTGQTKQLASGSGLLGPSIDPQGFVWTAKASATASLVAYGKDNASHAVAVAGVGAGDRLVTFQLSRDGTRALLVTMNATGARVLVAGVIRQDGVPQKLGTPLELASDVDAPTDVTWLDDSTVATLTPFGQESEVIAYDLGGPSESLGFSDRAVSIAGGNGGEDGLRLLSAGKALLRLRSANWQTTGISADLLVTQVPG